MEIDSFIINKWVQSDIDNEKEQKEAKLELEGIKMINREIRGFINTGNLAVKQLQEIEKLEEKK